MILLPFILILCYSYTCLTAGYDIVWDQNYFVNKDRYPSSYELPHNSPCSFCVDDVITLRINSTSNIYENLYRVPTVTAMMNCDASMNENDNVIAFNDKQEMTIRSGGSESALSFFLGNTYYFISTSNGTQASAENDLNQPPNSCLQLAFTVRLDSDSSCGTYAANCNFTTVFTDPTSLLRLQSNNSITTQMIPTMMTTLHITLCYVQGVGYIFCDKSSNAMFPNGYTVTWLFWLLLVLNILVGCAIIYCCLFGVITLPLYWFDIIPLKRRSEYRISHKISPKKQSEDPKECTPLYEEPTVTYKMDSPKDNRLDTKCDN